MALADQPVCIGPGGGAGQLPGRRGDPAHRTADGGGGGVSGVWFSFWESAGFAAAVEEAGLVWVGPPSGAIRLTGDKVSAKQAMIAAGAPCVPGAGRGAAGNRIRPATALYRRLRSLIDLNDARTCVVKVRGRIAGWRSSPGLNVACTGGWRQAPDRRGGGGAGGCDLPCCPSSPGQPGFADMLAASSSWCLYSRGSCRGVHAGADAA